MAQIVTARRSGELEVRDVTKAFCIWDRINNLAQVENSVLGWDNLPLSNKESIHRIMLYLTVGRYVLLALSLKK